MLQLRDSKTSLPDSPPCRFQPRCAVPITCVSQRVGSCVPGGVCGVIPVMSVMSDWKRAGECRVDTDSAGNVYVSSWDWPGYLTKLTPRPGADPAKLIGQKLGTRRSSN